jgi:hypothetical protein
MADAADPKLFDKRVSARYIKKGLLDAKEHERYLKSLPDLADKAVPIEATMEPTHVGASGNHPDEE